jgi:urea transport system ATP-binding protein
VAEEDVADLLALIQLTDKKDQPAGDLSHGERQWLEIGMLLASGARLLLLDEPTAGMTVTETKATANLIKGIAARGEATILVIEHDIGFIRELGCPVTVMSKGRVLRSGSYDEIRADDEVRALYFGRIQQGRH